jgi:hypothetical protein
MIEEISASSSADKVAKYSQLLAVIFTMSRLISPAVIKD